MRDIFKIPQPVVTSMEQLLDLIEEHPLSFSPPDLAGLLQTSPSSLRAAIDAGSFSPGYCWLKPGMKNRAYNIPTAPFYFWYTQQAGIWMEILRREVEKDNG